MKTNQVLHYSVFSTPAGKFSVAVDGNGAVAATAFGGRSALRRRFKEGTLVAGAAMTGAARRQVEAWFKGKRRDFSVALAPVGTTFQQRVWSALTKIPFGETRSYGDLARALGSSPRAVGRANANNPITLIVPCHRVIGADGSLTGYAFGQATKRRLLAFERA
jgi:methylated-DNA-[protein]-cysteine S-methyltransferase